MDYLAAGALIYAVLGYCITSIITSLTLFEAQMKVADDQYWLTI